MTNPFGGQAAQPGQRMANGYQVMGGGYDAAIQGQPGQQQVLLPPQLQQQTQLGQPAANNLPPQMQQFDQGGYAASQVPQDVRQFSQMRQLPPQQQPGQQQYTPQQQQQIAQYGFQPQQQQAPQGLDLNTRLTGPNIPQELQGRTVGEAIAIHNGLRQIHLQSMAGQPQAQQQTQFQPQNQQGNQQQQAGTQQPAWDWRNPQEAIGRVVDERLNGAMNRIEGMLAPVVQRTAIDGIKQARDTVAGEFGPQLFAQLEPAILQRLQGVDPRTLANPDSWRLAADSLLGAATRRGAFQPQPTVPGGFQPQQVGFQQQPMPNLNSFFSEQPNQGGPGAQGVQLTQNEIQAAYLMGQTPEAYAAWKGGVPVNQAAMFPGFGGAR